MVTNAFNYNLLNLPSSVTGSNAARFNRFEYRPIGQTEWTVVQTSRSRLKLEGLQPMSLHEFRVAYLGTDPTVTYSDVVTAYAG